MRIYISGPISGKDPEETRARFGHVAEMIREAGHVPVNPMDVYGWGLSWKTCIQMDFDVIQSGDIDGMYMLRGWDESHGACLERYFARLNGIPVHYQDPEEEAKFNRPRAYTGKCRGRGYGGAICVECPSFFGCEILSGR